MGMTDKPFSLIDEAAKAYLEPAANLMWDRLPLDTKNLLREKAKAVLDVIVPLIVERCAEVAENTFTSADSAADLAAAIRTLKPKPKPKEKRDG